MSLTNGPVSAFSGSCGCTSPGSTCHLPVSNGVQFTILAYPGFELVSFLSFICSNGCGSCFDDWQANN